MNKLVPFVVGVLIVLADPSFVAAQQERLYLGFDVALVECPYWFLLSNLTVQEELKLLPDQKAKFARFQDQHRDSRNRLMQAILMNKAKLRDKQADSLELKAVTEKVSELRRDLDRETDVLTDTLLGVLTRSQRARLDQIRIQLEGPIALTRKDVQEELKLDREQITKIEAILKEGRDEIYRVTELPPESERRTPEARGRPHTRRPVRRPASPAQRRTRRLLSVSTRAKAKPTERCSDNPSISENYRQKKWTRAVDSLRPSPGVTGSDFGPPRAVSEDGIRDIHRPSRARALIETPKVTGMP